MAEAIRIDAAGKEYKELNQEVRAVLAEADSVVLGAWA